MRPNLINRLKEEWAQLDPVGPLRGLISDAIDALAEQPAQPQQEPETFEAWNAKQHGDPEEIGFLQALRIAYISGQDSVLRTSPPASKPLTDEQEYEAIGTAGNDLLALAKRWADNEVHVYQFDNEARKIIKAVLHRAHSKGDA